MQQQSTARTVLEWTPAVILSALAIAFGLLIALDGRTLVQAQGMIAAVALTGVRMLPPQLLGLLAFVAVTGVMWFILGVAVSFDRETYGITRTRDRLFFSLRLVRTVFGMIVAVVVVGYFLILLSGRS